MELEQLGLRNDSLKVEELLQEIAVLKELQWEKLVTDKGNEIHELGFGKD